LLNEQIAQKKKIDERDMNEREFKLNKDLLVKASNALKKK